MRSKKPTSDTGDDERAVSPVIGVILMVAITVILAAVIAAFVLDLGPSETDPTAAVDVDDSAPAEIDVELTAYNDADGVALVVANDALEDDSKAAVSADGLPEGTVFKTLTVSGQSATVSNVTVDNDGDITLADQSTALSGDVEVEFEVHAYTGEDPETTDDFDNHAIVETFTLVIEDTS